MARQPDIQYVQIYQYSSTARKLDRHTPVRKSYELPQQQPRSPQVKKSGLNVLTMCSSVICVVLLLTMAMGLLKVGIMADRQQKLEVYIETLREKQADLQRAMDHSYDLELVEQRARQMGLVDASQAAHIQMGTISVPQEQEAEYTWSDWFEELFAKAPH